MRTRISCELVGVGEVHAVVSSAAYRKSGRDQLIWTSVILVRSGPTARRGRRDDKGEGGYSDERGRWTGIAFRLLRWAFECV